MDEPHDVRGLQPSVRGNWNRVEREGGLRMKILSECDMWMDGKRKEDIGKEAALLLFLGNWNRLERGKKWRVEDEDIARG